MGSSVAAAGPGEGERAGSVTRRWAVPRAFESRTGLLVYTLNIHLNERLVVISFGVRVRGRNNYWWVLDFFWVVIMIPEPATGSYSQDCVP